MDAYRTPGEVAAALVERCTALVRSRRVVIVGGTVAGHTDLVRQLRGYGATEVLVLAEGLGTGDLPADAEARVVVVPAPIVATATEEARSTIRFSDHPPAEAVAAVDAFDPDGSALCLLGPLATADRYCGRRSLGGRSPEVAALEDKALVDGIWDAGGVRRARSAVVGVEADRLRRAHARLDRGAGTVWSGDAVDGMNGGGDRVRWVRGEDDIAEALALFAPTTRRVRVMPFLEGVPCSIHGFVLPDGVAALRPLEQVILRRRQGGTFQYAGLSTCWDPPAADRDAMRAVAASAGRVLASRAGLRGGFSVDGVLTADGFLPTELNPRFSGGMATVARGLEALPLRLAQMAVARGLDIGVSAPEFERLLVDAADGTRSGAAYALTHRVAVTATESVPVTGGPHRLAEAGAGDDVVGAIDIGPAVVGALVRYRPAEAAPGLRLAPFAVAALAFADERWGAGFGPLEVAPDVRRPST